ncbi:MAG: 4Fe-4S binding protein [Deltaproteobacteria bacterium]|nr:4Fe-4S binding protein [Deltaproteobacteria bacterium]
MDSRRTGFRIETCSGSTGCRNRAVSTDSLGERLESLLSEAHLAEHLDPSGAAAPHRPLIVALAGCPNACTRPQVRDIGIIGASPPVVSPEPCSECWACAEVCREEAITVDPGDGPPRIDTSRCVRCGDCHEVCPSGALTAGASGFRVMIGGRLGRHPRLATEIPFLLTEDEVIELIGACAQLYVDRREGGRRFTDVFGEADLVRLITALVKAR